MRFWNAIAVRFTQSRARDRLDTGWSVRLERKLDRLAEHLDVDVGAPLSAEVRAALRHGNTIAAIKRYRAETGAGLDEAREAVAGRTNPRSLERKLDALLHHMGVPDPFAPSDAVQEAIRAGQTIEAIRRYRQETGVGLQQAKDAVDTVARELRHG